jgi:hypothetical protein
MTTQIKTFMRLAPLLAAISATAYGTDSIQVKVPFPFVTAGKTLPAADYRVQVRRDNGAITLSSTGGSATVLSEGEDRPASRPSSLRFLRTGDQWVLQEVTLADRSQVLLANRSQKEKTKAIPSCSDTSIAIAAATVR